MSGEPSFLTHMSEPFFLFLFLLYFWLLKRKEATLSPDEAEGGGTKFNWEESKGSRMVFFSKVFYEV